MSTGDGERSAAQRAFHRLGEHLLSMADTIRCQVEDCPNAADRSVQLESACGAAHVFCSGCMLRNLTPKMARPATCSLCAELICPRDVRKATVPMQMRAKSMAAYEAAMRCASAKCFSGGSVLSEAELWRLRAGDGRLAGLSLAAEQCRSVEQFISTQHLQQRVADSVEQADNGQEQGGPDGKKRESLNSSVLHRSGLEEESNEDAGASQCPTIGGDLVRTPSLATGAAAVVLQQLQLTAQEDTEGGGRQPLMVDPRPFGHAPDELVWAKYQRRWYPAHVLHALEPHETPAKRPNGVQVLVRFFDDRRRAHYIRKATGPLRPYYKHEKEFARPSLEEQMQRARQFGTEHNCEQMEADMLAGAKEPERRRSARRTPSIDHAHATPADRRSSSTRAPSADGGAGASTKAAPRRIAVDWQMGAAEKRALPPAIRLCILETDCGGAGKLAKSITHYVVKCPETALQAAVSPTLIAALLRGVWVLSAAWLDSGGGDEHAYEIDTVAPGSNTGVARAARHRAAAHEPGPLSGCAIVLPSGRGTGKTDLPPFTSAVFRRLVPLAGGTVLTQAHAHKAGHGAAPIVLGSVRGGSEECGATVFDLLVALCDQSHRPLMRNP